MVLLLWSCCCGPAVVVVVVAVAVGRGVIFADCCMVDIIQCRDVAGCCRCCYRWS